VVRERADLVRLPDPGGGGGSDGHVRRPRPTSCRRSGERS
jgi:hypothetical protein